jgi:hypothetical protein
VCTATLQREVDEDEIILRRALPALLWHHALELSLGAWIPIAFGKNGNEKSCSAWKRANLRSPG